MISIYDKPQWQTSLFKAADAETVCNVEQFIGKVVLWAEGTGSFLCKRGTIIDCVQGKGKYDSNSFYWNMDNVEYSVSNNNCKVNNIDAAKRVIFLDDMPDTQFSIGDVVYMYPDVGPLGEKELVEKTGTIIDLYKACFDLQAAEVLIGTSKFHMYTYKLKLNH